MQYSKGLENRIQRLEIGANAIVLLILLVNAVLPLINLQTGYIEMPYLFPAIRPVGADFRKGLYEPAGALLKGQTPYHSGVFPYPPFAAVFGLPFRLFSSQTGYLVLVILLFACTVAAIPLSLRIAQTVFSPRNGPASSERGRLAQTVFWQMAVLTLASYGFIFSVERGNFDIIPLFFSLLAVWLLIRQPRWLWPQVILLSLATHLKIYPAVLFVLLLWKHGWKSLLPVFVVNLGLLFITGPANVGYFLGMIIPYSGNPFIFVGNHSAVSFASYVNHFLSSRASITIPAFLFLLVPLLVWGVGAFILWKRKYSPLNAVLLYMLSVPLMNLIPSTSHDYKLVILSSPLAICLYFFYLDFVQTRKWADILSLAAVMGLLVLLTRSYTLLPQILMNKYPFIFLLQVGFLFTALRFSRQAETTEVAQPLELIPTG